MSALQASSKYGVASPTPSTWDSAKETSGSSTTNLGPRSEARPIPSVPRSDTWEVQDSSWLAPSKSFSTGDIWSWGGPGSLTTFTTMTSRTQSVSTVSTTNYMEDWESLWDAGQVPTLQEDFSEVGPTHGPPSSLPPSSATSSETSRADWNFPVFFPRQERQEETSSQSEAAASSYATMCSRAARAARAGDFCPQCGQPASQCGDARPLRKVDQKTIGRIIRTSGPSWPKSKLGRLALVLGAGGNGANVLLRWGVDSKVESFTINAKNVPKFVLVCGSAVTQPMEEGVSFSEAEGGMETAISVVRLPIRPFIREVWAHEDLGEKHRLIISADQDFALVAIGLLVETTIPKLIVSICQKNDHFEEHNSIFSQNFNKVQSYPRATTVIKLDKILLKGGEPYMLVLNVFGGSSLVGCGGEEKLGLGVSGIRGEIQLRLEDYRHRDNVCSKTTNVEKGLVEKFYIEN